MTIGCGHNHGAVRVAGSRLGPEGWQGQQDLQSTLCPASPYQRLLRHKGQQQWRMVCDKCWTWEINKAWPNTGRQSDLLLSCWRREVMYIAGFEEDDMQKDGLTHVAREGSDTAVD